MFYNKCLISNLQPSVRKTHCNGRKHKDNVRDYYQKWLEDQVQKLVDDTSKTVCLGDRILIFPSRSFQLLLSKPERSRATLSQLVEPPFHPLRVSLEIDRLLLVALLEHPPWVPPT
jgi:U1 small nuclear ribonucleoprotein C